MMHAATAIDMSIVCAAFGRHPSEWHQDREAMRIFIEAMQRREIPIAKAIRPAYTEDGSGPRLLVHRAALNSVFHFLITDPPNRALELFALVGEPIDDDDDADDNTNDDGDPLSDPPSTD